MTKNTPKNKSQQLSIFDPDSDQRPHPLLVAEKWGFKLSYVDRDGNPAHYLYHAVQWTMGLGATTHVTWIEIRDQLVASSNTSLKVYYQSYTAEDGKAYEVEFIDQYSCYLISQNMRLTKDRPQLKEIQQHLAKAMFEFDKLRRDSDKVEAMAVIDRRREIEKHEKAGYGNHPEVQRLKDRDMNIAVFQSLKHTINQICSDPQWGKLINAEYLAMFNETAKTLEVILNSKSVRDGLPSLQLTWLTAAERSLQAALNQQDRLTSSQIEQVINKIMPPIGQILRDLCDDLGIHHITGKPLIEGKTK